MTALLDAIRSKTDRALASGDLSPLETSETVVEQNGLRFIVRWAEALARKDAAKAAAPAAAPAPATGADAVILPGGPRDPNFNPFLNPDPALTVGPIGTQHTIVLNKFPVCLHHLVLARRDFAEQLTPLELCDFEVLAQLLCTLGGLGFYNGGAPAGASQRHKHVQWVPAEPGNASLAQLAAGLPADAQPGVVYRHPALPMAHALLKVDVGLGADQNASAAAMLAAYHQARADLGLVPGADGLLPSFNMLVGSGWLLLVPRSQEHFEGVSINALSFGGTIYVRQPEQVELIRQTGPLQALGRVGRALS